MFQRRKILLTLLKACGGELTNVDMQKLLFCYCAETDRNYYDFFPHRFGCYSILASQDKRVLTTQGYLSTSEGFKLKRGIPRGAVDKTEIADLVAFVARMKNMRGKKLVRYVYVNYPSYAVRSEIRHSVLNKSEASLVERYANKETDPTLFTIGYEGLTIDAYIKKLIENNVAMVVDVRRNPLSMKYGFSKTRFSNYLQSAGIKYEHIPALGIESSLRRTLESDRDYVRLFEKYESRMLPGRHVELERIRNLVSSHRRVALTCFEADPASCHRHKITERLQSLSDWKTTICHIF